MPNITPSNDKIAAKFRELHAKKEGALIAFLTGGDPTPESFLADAAALVEGGADILEVGIPFSDPIADGPVIQASSRRALAKGATASKILELIAKLSRSHDTPIVVLTYYNPILAVGPDRFVENANECGVDGLVVPDLSVEESLPLRKAAQRHHVDMIFLTAPNTSPSRMSTILALSQGFVYLVSLYGVTGSRKELSPLALKAVANVRKMAKGRIPIAAGFGISQPHQVSALLGAGADGAIVGSALVEIVGDHLDKPETAAAELRQTVAELKKATRSE